MCIRDRISDSGIAPGSGVQNSRKELSRRTLGIPVLSIGVPTVIDAATLEMCIRDSCETDRSSSNESWS